MKHRTVISMSRISAQRGGTMLGFIIGGVVGVLAALIVAVFVAKVPVPFVNKAVNRNAEQDAAEAVKNKNWDPNAPLASKQPIKPAAEVSGVVASAAASSAGVAPTAPPAASKATEKPPEKTVDKPAAKATSADPLGDLVKAKTSGSPAGNASGAAPTPPATAKDSDSFFVQAGAYTTAEDAEAQRGRLSLGGFESKVSEREVSGRTVFRVRIGPIEKKADADKTRERLEALGVDARVMSVSR